MQNDLNLEDRPGLIARIWDCETTGTPEDEDAEIIELGRIDLDLTSHEISNPWRSFANPRGPIPDVTKAVHHITEADVADAPPVGRLWQPFWEGCGPDDIVVAHNADFEKHFHNGNGRRWICTYKGARVVWPDAPSHSNQGLRYWLRIDDDQDFDSEAAMPPHRALPDAYTTAFILRRLLQEKTAEELVKISKFPALLKRINFGTKAKGQTYEEAPVDYLLWILNKSDMGADIKFTAKYWLKKRGVIG